MACLAEAVVWALRTATPTFSVVGVAAAEVAAELLVVVVAEPKPVAAVQTWLGRGLLTAVDGQAFVVTAAAVSDGWAPQHPAAAHVLDSVLTSHGVGGAAVRQMTVTVHGVLGPVSRPWTVSGHVSLRGCCPLAFALNSMSCWPA